MKNLTSKFSVIGKEELNSEAKGNYTIVNITFVYRGAMYEGQITLAGNIKTLSFMKREGATRQSGLSVRDKVRHEVIRAYDEYVAADTNEQLLIGLPLQNGVESEVEVINDGVFKGYTAYTSPNVDESKRVALNFDHIPFNKEHFEVGDIVQFSWSPLYFIVDGQSDDMVYVKEILKSGKVSKRNSKAEYKVQVNFIARKHIVVNESIVQQEVEEVVAEPTPMQKVINKCNFIKETYGINYVIYEDNLNAFHGVPQIMFEVDDCGFRIGVDTAINMLNANLDFFFIRDVLQVFDYGNCKTVTHNIEKHLQVLKDILVNKYWIAVDISDNVVSFTNTYGLNRIYGLYHVLAHPIDEKVKEILKDLKMGGDN